MTPTTVEERLARIEEKLDNTLSWLSKRDIECKQLESMLSTIRVEQGKQGVVIWLFSGIISAVVASVIGFIIKL